MKYIDAEKLIAEIESLKEKSERRPHVTPLEGFECMGKVKLCDELFSIINSLQQEQPDDKLTNIAYWLEYFGMPEENIENCTTQISHGYGAIRYLEGIQHGAEAVNELAQLDDLAKEIDAVSKRYPEVSFAKLSRIAKHFAEWQKEQDIEFGISDDPEVQKAANYYCEQTKPGEVCGAEVWDAFTKGAEWQKKQDEQQCQGCFDRDEVFWKGMQHAKEEWMKEAVEGILVDMIDGTKEICLHDNRYGQKVKLIILKDDETEWLWTGDI